MTLFEILIFSTSIITCLTSFITFLLYERRLKSTRELEMSKKLYLPHLLVYLPNLFAEFIKSNQSEESIVDFSTHLKTFRKDLGYFKYAHATIYQTVNQAIRRIDEELCISIQNVKNPLNKTNKLADMMSINQSLNTIYKAFLYELPDDHIDKYFKTK
ncbi:hypothetical protein [Fructobacillus durionis]|uniref:Uncharacterized protein n=1 Tax=Fructobacillus durionis TaxID=283737 RepID=A0A1I1H3C6_9LACO|nr:hypothetical protein [Fructobacillus durionis]SFC15953.1 hypothetical protein SAMN05660453_1212 [Fructobacillus durionis]